MAENQPTAKAEAKYPIHWDIYWNLRMVLKYPLVKARQQMTQQIGYIEEWGKLTDYQVRKLEMLCLHTTTCSEPAPCDCPRCR